MEIVKSSSIIKKQKKDFYQNIIKIVKSKEAYLTKEINDNATNLLITDSSNGLKIGPVIGSFDPKNSYNMDYYDIVKNLALSISPYSTNKDARFSQKIQEIALSTKSVETQIGLKDGLRFSMDMDNILSPTGFKGQIQNLDIISNPKIPYSVEAIIEDKLKATQSIQEIYKYGFDSYYLTKLFSSGLLGIDRRFITTRQSITAIDDNIGKMLLEDIRNFDQNQKYLIFQNEFLHNRFIILLLPGKFEFEQYELWPKGSEWGSELGYNREYESYNGRTSYASMQAGGYYASRLSILEYLFSKKIQSKVVVFRIINDSYSIPVGVWQVRENVLHAFDKKPQEFESKQEIIDFLKKNLKSNANQMIRESKILYQTRISEFF